MAARLNEIEDRKATSLTGRRESPSDDKQTHSTANKSSKSVQDLDETTPSDAPRGSAKQHQQRNSVRINKKTGECFYTDTDNDSWVINYYGIIIILPIIFNAFQDKHLEKSYQRYSNGQRKKSLIIAHTIDLLLKLCLFFIPLLNLGHRFLAPNQQDSLSMTGNDPLFGADGIRAHNISTREAFISSLINMDDVSLWKIERPEDKIKLTDLLLFGPLRQVSSQLSMNRSETDLERLGSLKKEELGTFLYHPINAFKMLIKKLDQKDLLMQLIENYRLNTILCAINLATIIACFMVPQRKLRDKLSYIALMSWFLFCIQNTLIYSATEMDLKFSISSLISENKKQSPSDNDINVSLRRKKNQLI